MKNFIKTKSRSGLLSTCYNNFTLNNAYLRLLFLTTIFFISGSFRLDKNGTDDHRDYNHEKEKKDTRQGLDKKKNVGLPKKFTAPGDFSLDFTAAAPLTYNHATGGGAYDDRTIGTNQDVVESLEGGDFNCGDIVTFLTQITVDQGATGSQTIAIDYSFLADATGQSGVGLCDIVGVKINYGNVGGDGSGGTDAGISDDGGSTATLSNEQITGNGNCFVSGNETIGTVTVTDLEAGEKVVVRVDVRISCDPGSHPTGNLQAALTGAQVTAPAGETGNIGVGNQTIPFKNVGSIVCEFSIACPTNTNLGTFNCTNLNNIPPKPTSLQDLRDLGFTFGTPCGVIRFIVADSGRIDACIGTNQTITRTIVEWDDLNGNSIFDLGSETGVTCKLTFIIEADKTPPYIKCPADLTVECLDDVPQVDITKVDATDNCGKVTVSFVKDSAVGTCPKIIYRIYKAVDECYNSSYCTQKITVEDKTPPYIKCPADLTVECLDDVPSPDITKVDATDNCGKVTVSFVKDSTVGTCPKIIYRKYKAVDDCYNTSYCTQKITVDDKTPPVIYCPADITIASCLGNVPYPDITKVRASDNCGKVTVSFVKDSSVGTCPKIIYRKYKAVDACYNTSYCTQKITVPCCVYCTYTQGFYHNKNGLALLPSLLTTPITIGRTGHSVIIPANTSTVQSAVKLNSILPGGSTPDVLKAGNCSIMDVCLNSYLTSQGRINNILLSQTITLSLNVRLKAGILAGFPIQSGYISTQGGGCVKINSNVVKYLTANGTKTATVSDLLNLANDVLGGTKTAGVAGVPSLSNINDAVDAINNAFDGCRSFTGYTPNCSAPISSSKTWSADQAVEDVATLKVNAAPNPFTDRVKFVINSGVSGQASLEVFNLQGQKTGIVFQGFIVAGQTRTIDYTVPALNKGSLTYRFTVGNRQVTGLLINAR